MDSLLELIKAFGFIDCLIYTLLAFNILSLWMQSRHKMLARISVRRQIALSKLLLDLFPILGILGTVWGLIETMRVMGTVAFEQVVKEFSVALTSTFSGLLAVGISLVAANFFERQSDTP